MPRTASGVRRRLLVLASAAALLCLACTPCRTSADCGDGQACSEGKCAAAALCTAGATQACVCGDGGAFGTSVCNASGTSYGACLCGADACTAATCTAVPSLVGKDLDSAGPLVSGAGFQLPDPIDPLGYQVVQRVADPPVSVVGQLPAAGSPFPNGAALGLQVTIPPDQESLGLPNNRFLVGQLQQDSPESAQAYYNVLDPPAISARTTLIDWKAANGFGQPADLEASAIYQNHTDLGFGRHMHMRKKGKRVAFYVDNYPTLKEAIDGTHLIATVAMEWSPRAGGTEADPHFTQFYVFNPKGERITDPILDDFGPKLQPAVCLGCHGGAVTDPTYSNGGDVGARFIPFDLDSLAYSDRPGYTRADQEAAFKAFNEAVKSTYPPGDTSPVPELIDGWYGGPAHPAAHFDGSFTPVAWRTPAGAAALYHAVFARSCRGCHAQREAFRDFSSYAQFVTEKPLIKTRVFEEAAMPLSERGYLNFWLSSPSQPKILAAAIGMPALVGPGRPVARITPSNAVPAGSHVVIDASDSQFSSTFEWTQTGGPTVALAPAGPKVSFTAPAVAASLTLRLVTGLGALRSAPQTITIAVAGAPGVPTGVTAAPRVGGAQVSWAPPASNGGAALVAFRIVASPGGATATAAGDATSGLIVGLTPGASYTFTVAAENAAGLTSAPSAPSAAILVPNVPVGSPSAPTSLVVTRGAASATVSWAAPADHGSSPISSYTITVTKGAATVVTIPNAVSPTNIGAPTYPALTTCNYRPVPSAQTCGAQSQYSFTVTATNAQGTGLAASASAVPFVSYSKDGIAKIWTQAVLPGGSSCASCHDATHAPDLTSPEPTPYNQARAYAAPLDPGNRIVTYPSATDFFHTKMCAAGTAVCYPTTSAESITIQQWVVDGARP